MGPEPIAVPTALDHLALTSSTSAAPAGDRLTSFTAPPASAHPAVHQATALVCSVDVEEDNWAPAREGLTAENVRELPALHDRLRTLGIRPTYFVAYQAIRDAEARAIIRALGACDGTEVGAHLHPWNTPPIAESFNARSTMLNTLPVTLQLAKLRVLTDELRSVTGSAPVSFRAGRLGLGSTTVVALLECGYRVDSSVCPFTDLRDEHGPDFSRAPLGAYRLSSYGPVSVPNEDGALVEVPLTAAFSRRPFRHWSVVHSALSGTTGRRLRLPGIAHRAGLVQRISMAPERESVANMLVLARRIVEEGSGLIHVCFHSSTLRAGATPWTRTTADVERFVDSIARLVDGIADIAPVQTLTVREAADALAPPDKAEVRA